MRRKKFRRKYFVFNFINLLEIFLIFFLFGLFFFLLRSDFFKVSLIDCQKERFICSDQEMNLFTHVLGENIFLVDTRELVTKAKLKDIIIQDIKVKKKLPDRLLIRLLRREPVAVLSTPENNFLVDETGFVYSNMIDENSDLPIVRVGNQGIVVGEEVGPKARQALDLIKVLNNFFLPYNQLLVNDESLTLLAPQLIATFSASKDFWIQATSLQLILRSSKISRAKLVKIDLRFDKPVVISNE